MEQLNSILYLIKINYQQINYSKKYNFFFCSGIMTLWRGALHLIGL